MRIFLTGFFLIFIPVSIFSQEILIPSPQIDSLYREDQFYLGFTYNLLINKHTDIRDQGFSGGLHLGFLRDMPVNERRNIAVAVGAGYSMNKYGHNLFVGEDEYNNTVFAALDNSVSYKTNRLVTHEIELPIELRWRTSTPKSYRFWRIYTGVKLGYVFFHKATYKEEEPDLDITKTNIPEFNKFRTAVLLNFGYNTFNFQLQYDISPLFNKDTRLNDEPIDLSPIKLGLIFYIL